jgi:hypothetical protein
MIDFRNIFASFRFHWLLSPRRKSRIFTRFLTVKSIISALILTHWALIQPQIIRSALGQATEVDSNPDRHVSRILEDWKQRRSRGQAVRINAEGEFVYPKSSLIKAFEWGSKSSGEQTPEVSEDYRSKAICDLLIDFSKNRFRYREAFPLLNLGRRTFTSLDRLYVFSNDDLRCHDSEVTALRRDDASNLQPEFIIHKLDRPIMTTWCDPAFFACGVVLPSDSMSLIGRLADSQDAKYFSFLRQEVLNGIDCIVLRYGEQGALRKRELWVDPSRNSVIVRADDYMDKQRFGSIEIEYAQVNGNWVPAKWRWSDLNPQDGEPFRVATMKQVVFELNPSLAESDFDLKPSPGMIVSDERKVKVYTVGDRGEELPVNPLGAQRTETSPGRIAALYVTIGVIVVCLILIVVKQKLARTN